MNNPNSIKDELNSLGSELNPSAQSSTYQVPQGYFEGLADAVMARIRTEGVQDAKEEISLLSPLLAEISRKMPFSLPEGYFAENIEALPAFTSDESSSVLGSIGKNMPFSVEEGYFESLPEMVKSRVELPQQAKVVGIRRNWMRIAAAAVVFGIIALTGIFYFNQPNEVPVDSPKWVASELKKVSDQEINEFVNQTTVSATTPFTAQAKPVKAPEVEELLEEVSDQELEAFLEGVPTDEFFMGAEEDLGIN